MSGRNVVVRKGGLHSSAQHTDQGYDGKVGQENTVQRKEKSSNFLLKIYMKAAFSSAVR
jgi:hypothetical protein